MTAMPEVLLPGEKPPPLVEPVEVNDHVTPWFPVSLVRVAVTARVCDVVIPPRLGDTLTVMFEPPEEEVVAGAVFE
jgi:hypothetical protein